MGKECWQLTNLETPTPCFKLAGNRPCDTEGCSVIDRINTLIKEGIEIDSWWIRILPHSACRLSSISPNNEEFVERIKRV